MKPLGAKLSAPVRTTVWLPERLLSNLQSSMSEAGYGQKSRSRWIGEAIEMLLDAEGYIEIVHENFLDGRGKVVHIPLNLPGVYVSSLKKVEQGCYEACGTSDISRSQIIRAAITFRLFRDSGGAIA